MQQSSLSSPFGCLLPVLPSTYIFHPIRALSFVRSDSRSSARSLPGPIRSQRHRLASLRLASPRLGTSRSALTQGAGFWVSVTHRHDLVALYSCLVPSPSFVLVTHPYLSFLTFPISGHLHVANALPVCLPSAPVSPVRYRLPGPRSCQTRNSDPVAWLTAATEACHPRTRSRGPGTGLGAASRPA